MLESSLVLLSKLVPAKTSAGTSCSNEEEGGKKGRKGDQQNRADSPTASQSSESEVREMCVPACIQLCVVKGVFADIYVYGHEGVCY